MWASRPEGAAPQLRPDEVVGVGCLQNGVTMYGRVEVVLRMCLTKCIYLRASYNLHSVLVFLDNQGDVVGRV